MAELGAFRTGLSGFNKKDVLDYIDSMQLSHAEELNQQAAMADNLRRQISQAEEKASAAADRADQAGAEVAAMREENQQLQQSLDEALRFVSELKAQAAEMDALRREREDFRSRAAEAEARAEEAYAHTEENGRLRLENRRLAGELEQLRQQTVPAEAVDTERAQSQSRIAALEEQAARLTAENDRLNGLVGDVGELIMEVRSMGQRYLDSACRRGEEGIEALDGAVASLQRQLEEAKGDVDAARDELKEQREAAAARLEEMVQSLVRQADESAAPPSPTEKGTGKTEGEADDKPSFFRWAAGKGGVQDGR